MQNALNPNCPPAAMVPYRAPVELFVVVADGEFDLVCEGRESALAHAKDLREMGCKTRLIPAKSWQHADQIEDKLRGY
jgi:hypothetical protein